MKRFLSGLVFSASFVALAGAQTPVVVKDVENNLRAMRRDDDPFREAIERHPDVRVARAKLQVAEAELAQARLLVSQRLANLKSEIEVLNSSIAAQEKLLTQIAERTKVGTLPQEHLLTAQVKIVELLSARTRLTNELDGLTKPEPATKAAPGAAALEGWERVKLLSDKEQAELTRNLLGAGATPVAPGSPADRLRSILDRPVKLDIRDRLAGLVIEDLFKALKADVRVRLPYLDPNDKMVKPVTLTLSGEMTLVPWLEFILDDVNAKLPKVPDLQHDVYVREYGLLIAPRSTTPKDAVTLRQYATQVRAEKAAKESKRP